MKEEPLRPDDIMDTMFVAEMHLAFVRRNGRDRLEIMEPHPHPMLVRCSERAWKKGKRSRLCGCPECHAAFDRSL